MKKVPVRHSALLVKLMWLDVLVVGVMLLLSVGLSAKHSVTLLEAGLTQNLHNVAQLLATNGQIIEALRVGRVDSELNRYLDATLANQNNIDVITVADMNAIRIYHPNKDFVGRHFFGGDEGPALSGANYPSKAMGTLGYQSRYFYPVYDYDQKQLGFVHVSMLMSNLTRLRDNVVKVNLQTLVVVFLVGAMAAVFISMNIKRSLLGFEPDQLTNIFLQRGEIMDSLAEGLLAVNNSGQVILVNEAAEAILGMSQNQLLNQDIDNFFPQLKIKDTLDDKTKFNLNVAINEKNILCDRVPINSDHQVIGAVAILRDHSEVTRLAEQLTGVNHILDALRANTHEFMNQLHIILGLIRNGDLQEAEAFITSVGDFQNATVSTVFKHIQNRVLSALVLGKINKCHEIGIKMIVAPHSIIPRHSRFLSTKALVTIVGNLVENAIDAINEKSDSDTASITLLVHEDELSLMIMLDDTGIGLTAQEIELMSQPGYSTKGANRGLGMSLIRGVVDTYKGEFTVESDKGVGTSMTLVFNQPRAGRPPSPTPTTNQAEPEHPANSLTNP
ncbi:MAG: GHKL domain-containing protein [Deltaproteobacteria bacterium]|jgi:sensor histidine kinase regulating citrate/malate metabolism|nr:GHKL domain-containing protein [Deltaproteobacteria bacterium]